jgi:hypothetical protein
LSELERRQHAVQYLEKIFQVAFWLDGLSAAGDAGGTYARFIKELTKPAPPVPPAPLPGATGSVSVLNGDERGPAGGVDHEFAGIGAVSSPGEEPVVVPSSPEPLRTIELEQAEIDFLASPEIAALAGSTPRGVKRLVNVYRLVRSRLVQSGGSPMGMAAMPRDYPLAAIAVAIETGQTVEVADAFLKALSALPPGTEMLSRTPAAARQFGTEWTLSSAFIEAFYDPAGESEAAGPHPAAGRYLYGKCPALQPAFIAAYAMRAGRLASGDMLRIAKMARRYSFNRNH